MTATPLSRRERVRADTIREIRAHATRQVDEGGAPALSLNAIAKEMGMSGPALYRYYASRHELRGALLTDFYTQLHEALAAAHQAGGRRSVAARLAAVATAYREWALRHPHRYALMLGGRDESAASDPPEAIAASYDAMLVLLRAIADLVGDRADRDRPHRLDRQFVAWARRHPAASEFPPLVLRLGVLFWTRLHGIVSLELSAAFHDMGLDGAALLDDEVKRFVDEAGNRP